MKQISMNLSGEKSIIKGVRRLLYEIIYNLCDNAIRYNVDGGKVTVRVSKDSGRAEISVSDTGIGIAPEHHGRIFERFYKVDKSRSASKNSTGLGLYIVKTIITAHGGTVAVSSKENEFTAFKVTLP